MKRTATLGILSLIAGFAFGLGSLAAGIQVPPAGSTMVYECEGPWTKEYINTVAWVKDGIVRTEGTAEGKAYWIEEPIFAVGLSLFLRRETANGKGGYKQSIDIENIEEIAKLEPGSTFSGSTREWGRNTKWTWGYDISVGEPEIIDQPKRGKIEVTPVIVKRLTYQTSYSSTATNYYDSTSGFLVRWRYRDADGVEVCDLVEME